MLGLVAHLTNAFLIWLIVGRLSPHRQLLGTLLYAWNPLCLLEFCASAHNDAVMLTFLLLGIYCLLRGWEGRRSGELWPVNFSQVCPAGATASLPGSGHSQDPGTWRHKAAALVGWLACSGSCRSGGPELLPYWSGPQTLAAMPILRRHSNSIIHC